MNNEEELIQLRKTLAVLLIDVKSIRVKIEKLERELGVTTTT